MRVEGKTNKQAKRKEEEEEGEGEGEGENRARGHHRLWTASFLSRALISFTILYIAIDRILPLELCRRGFHRSYR